MDTAFTHNNGSLRYQQAEAARGVCIDFERIEITVVDIRGDKVRLGITAPSKIPVHRKEVYDAIKRENQEAANVTLEDIVNFKDRATNDQAERNKIDKENRNKKKSKSIKKLFEIILFPVNPVNPVKKQI